MTLTRLLCCLVLAPLFCAGSVNAQTLVCDDKALHWESGLSAGLDNDGYEFGVHAAYYPVQYFGLRASLGFAGEIERVEDWGEDPWGDDYRDYGHRYAARFKFCPALVLRTPRIVRWKSQEAGFYLFAEPGMVLSPGSSGSRGARWCCWDVKAGVNFQLSQYVFTLGYGVSDFSLYSGRPYNMQGLPDNDNYITHTVYIGCAFKF